MNDTITVGSDVTKTSRTELALRKNKVTHAISLVLGSNSSQRTTHRIGERGQYKATHSRTVGRNFDAIGDREETHSN